MRKIKVGDRLKLKYNSGIEELIEVGDSVKISRIVKKGWPANIFGLDIPELSQDHYWVSEPKSLSNYPFTREYFN